jgi:hypothetical protein
MGHIYIDSPINRKEHMSKLKQEREQRKERIDLLVSLLCLTKEAKIHDEIFINELSNIEDKQVGVDGQLKLGTKCVKVLDWFRQHNAEAYMVLLD